MIAVQAVRDTLRGGQPSQNIQRAYQILNRASYMLEQYEHGLGQAPSAPIARRKVGLGRAGSRSGPVGLVMPPPLFPMPGGYRGPVRAITGPATGPAVPWLPSGPGGGLAVRRFNIMWQVIPMLHEVRQLLRAETSGLGDTTTTTTQPPASTAGETGAKAVAAALPLPPSLLDRIVEIEHSLPKGSPIRLQLTQARADTLTREKQLARREQHKAVPGADQPLGKRLLNAAYKASLIYAGLRLLGQPTKRSLFIGAAGGAAIEWVGVEAALKAGTLSALRSFIDL